MGRPPIALSPEVAAAIAARTARGESAETIKGALLGAPSVRTIKRRQRELRAGRPVATAPAAPPAPVAAPDERDALLDAYGHAGDANEARAAAVALRRYDDPCFAAQLDAGATVAEALLESDPVVGDLLASAEALAALARHATAHFGYRETPDEKGDRRRAFDLLADALELVGGKS